jgi:chitinase
MLVVACVVGLSGSAVPSLVSTSALEEQNADESYFVSAAYPFWRSFVHPYEDIPLEYVQSIGHSFVLPGDGGTLLIPDGFLMPGLIEHVHAANKRVGLGVGGAESHDEFVSVVSDPAIRASFIKRLTDFVIAQGYDGVTIDWEFPQTVTDSENLNALMAELRSSLDATDRDLTLSIAVASSEWFGRWIDSETITPLVDYYVVMTFGFHGSWGEQSGHNAPLYSPPPEVERAGSVDEAIRYWADTRGVPRSKLVMGLASFGIWFDSEGLYRPFTSSGQGYYNEIQPLIGNGYTRRWDSTCQVPYLTQDEGPRLWSYDDPRSIELKCDYVIANNLAGVAVWDVTGDSIGGQYPLLETIAEKLMPQPGVDLTADPDRVVIQVGQTATYNLSVAATIPAVGPVTLSLSGSPPGVSVSFNPNPVGPPGTSRLTIANTDDLPLATYYMAVTGVDAELSFSDTIPISLTVTVPWLYLPIIQK